MKKQTSEKYQGLRAVHDPGNENVAGHPVRVIVNGGSTPVGQIAYASGRWFVMNGFDDLLPFQFNLHMTIERSVSIIERRLTT